MAELTVDATLVSPVEILKQWSAPGAGAIPAGKAVYRDPTTGYATLCGATDTPEGIAITTTSGAKQTVTAVQQGRIDLGGTVLAAVAFRTTVYVAADGGLQVSPTGETPPPSVGTVIPVFSRESSNALAPDHLLDVNL